MPRPSASRAPVVGMLALLLCAALPIAAAEPARQLSVTIYNGDLALVQDTRTLPIEAGRQRLEFPGVSAQIRPETVQLQGDGLAVLEQNFDFDLLTPGKLMEKAVGNTVRIVRTNPATGQQVTETAQVLAANEGVVLRIGDRIEVLRDDGLPVRVLFDRIPPNLRARPTLSVQVDSAQAGTRATTLRYLTGGLSWRTDYVGLYDERNERLELQGWVTLSNNSGVGYENVRTQLIAGRPGQIFGARSTSAHPITPMAVGVSRANMARAGSAPEAGPSAVPEAATDATPTDDTAFGDFHLYRLPEATTIAENQVKQVALVDAPNVRAQKIYLVQANGYGSAPTANGAAVQLRFANTAASGLGRALPAGVLRLYARDASGRSQFIGEDNIDHTPQGSDMAVDVGTAFDVTYQPTLERSETNLGGSVTSQMRYVFRNARDVPVKLRFEQRCGNPENAVEDASAKPVRENAFTYVWTLDVPARGETVLTYAIREG